MSKKKRSCRTCIKDTGVLKKETPSSRRTSRPPWDYVGKVELLLHGVEKWVPDLQ